MHLLRPLFEMVPPIAAAYAAAERISILFKPDLRLYILYPGSIIGKTQYIINWDQPAENIVFWCCDVSRCFPELFRRADRHDVNTAPYKQEYVHRV